MTSRGEPPTAFFAPLVMFRIACDAEEEATTQQHQHRMRKCRFWVWVARVLKRDWGKKTWCQNWAFSFPRFYSSPPTDLKGLKRFFAESHCYDCDSFFLSFLFRVMKNQEMPKWVSHSRVESIASPRPSQSTGRLTSGLPFAHCNHHQLEHDIT